MDKVIDFIKGNYLVIAASLFFFGLYCYYDMAGNSLCDCETTENYKPNGSGRAGIGRFYHK